MIKKLIYNALSIINTILASIVYFFDYTSILPDVFQHVANDYVSSVVILILVFATIYLQWDRVKLVLIQIRGKVVPYIENIARKFHGVIALANVLALLIILILSVFIFLSVNSHKELTQLMATKYVASFPDDTRYILELLKKVNGMDDTLTIIVDYPAYGSYSNLEKYSKIEELLIRVSTQDKARINVCYYEHGLAIRDLREYRSIQEDSGSKEFKQWRDKFYPGATISTDEQFYNALLKVDTQLLSRMKSVDSNVRERAIILEKPPIFLWLLNDDYAVFSFSSGSNTFETTDSNLISAFKHLASEICLKHLD
uniref:Uncharacterized protein n=1 Tax=Candidatus Kentrum sp. UNK TaxID=2126344 RepID=A0A451AII1_9GAMM|nr:MAG: hypothetical protein BECKUNK1418G_GA0071005_10714 [Candidatus Kentron sp. UNK]VFK71565.1 MAG: hypothetical protein BECKUNK1418H_GA0071006_10724 [Candidatus Kentron sp. UNK]